MTKGPMKNLVASVRQRLMNIAKSEARPFSDVLQYYALERWLFRLAQSRFRDRMILKGALLLVVWKLPAMRPTRDIDLLGCLANDLETIRAAIAEICRVQVEEDGLAFQDALVKTERITEDADYHGTRATFTATLGNARVPMRIDIGFSDVVTPGPAVVHLPPILQMPPAELLAYNRETAIAEKFEAMVKLGELNSRMKDFFDIALLAANFEFSGDALAAAIRATFRQRHTAILLDPVCFSDRFASTPAKIMQWKAFVRRSLIANALDFPQVAANIRTFLQPVAQKLAHNDAFEQRWRPGGPWR